MDRSSLLLRRFVLPWAGLCSAGLLWLALPGRATPPQPAVAVRAAGDLEANRAATERNRESQSSAVPAVLPAAFLDGKPLDGELSWPANGAPPDCPALAPANTTAPADAMEPGSPRLLAPQLEPQHVLAPVAAPPAADASVPPPPVGTPVPVINQAPSVLAPNMAETNPQVLAAPPLAEPVRKTATGRSRQLEAVAQEADRHTRHGFELASRGAYYAARREFLTSLRLMAQGLDAEYQSAEHSRALSAALTAIAEADEFAPQRLEFDVDLDVAQIAARHRTPVLKGAAESVTPLEAARMYFTFAQEQLGRAVGSEIAGSMALQGLGKLHSVLAEQEPLRTRSAESKAMTFLQAALLAEPKNYMASNDLGVLLARAGYYAEARTALEHSVGISPQPAGWRNLAEVYRRLGDQERAARAAQSCQLAEREMAQRRLTPGARVEWIDPPMFAQTFAQTPSAREPFPARQPAKTEQPAKAEQPVAQKPLFGNLLEKR